MFTLFHEQTGTTAIASERCVYGFATSLLEVIGDDGDDMFTISNGQTTISVAYNGQEYIINGNAYRRFYDADDALTYIIQDMLNGKI